jgi:hypothetical protein
MEILYSIFIGIIFGMNVGMIVGIGLLCRCDTGRVGHQPDRAYARKIHPQLQ